MTSKDGSSSQIKILEEKIKFLEEQNRLKDVIIKFQEEKIQNLEQKINEFGLKNTNSIKSISNNILNLNLEIKDIKKIPSGKAITCHNKFEGVNYFLGSYRYFNEEKIGDKRNKIWIL